MRATRPSSMPAIWMAPAAARALLLPDRHHRSPTDESEVARCRSAERPGADHAVGGGATKLQAGAHPGRLGEFHTVGAVHHAWRAGRDVPGRLRLGVPDPAGSRLRRDRLRDDPRGAHHPARRASASRSELPLVERRFQGALGRQHPGRGHHRLQRQGQRRDQRGDPACSRDSAERGAARRRALHARRREHDQLRRRRSRIRRSSPLPGRWRCPYTASRITSSSSTRVTRGTTPSRIRSARAARETGPRRAPAAQ